MLIDQKRPFTKSGSLDVERRVRDVIAEVAMVIEQTTCPDQLHALVLIGGYGRGEGGVRKQDGRQVPNNNLDFLLIGRHRCQHRFSEWQQLANARLAKLQQDYDIGIDLSIISGRKLRRAPSRIMWYDMRGGHRTILGDAGFVPSLHRVRVERIPAWDVHNLIVNRGTLLLINDCLPISAVEESVQRTRLRHRAKAVIGFGDALLFCHGRYHWSYVEKQKRMQSLGEVAAIFRQLYSEASRYRFHPDTVPGDLLNSRQAVRSQCELVHRQFESYRLGQTLSNWDSYLETALRHGWREDSSSVTGWLRKTRNMIRGRSKARVGNAWNAVLGQRMLAPQRMLGLLSPAVLYEQSPPSFRRLAATWLGEESTDATCLRNAFLRSWGQVVDRNFARAWQRDTFKSETRRETHDLFNG